MSGYREDNASLETLIWWQSLSERKRDYLSATAIAAVFFAMMPLFGGGKAFATAAVVAVFSTIISRKWDRLRDWRLLMTLCAFAVIHILALWIIKFPEQISPSLMVLPLAVADGLVIWWVLEWLEKRLSKIPD